MEARTCDSIRRSLAYTTYFERALSQARLQVDLQACRRNMGSIQVFLADASPCQRIFLFDTGLADAASHVLSWCVLCLQEYQLYGQRQPPSRCLQTCCELRSAFTEEKAKKVCKSSHRPLPASGKLLAGQTCSSRQRHRPQGHLFEADLTIEQLKCMTRPGACANSRELNPLSSPISQNSCA